ncbi:methionine--tRNA ligase [Candidatus Woesearchaeota archaeon]|nr:methionine--tRNA ligase [Candidatus Woesearchaeota archaeon]
MAKKMLITSALPYVNAVPHLGNIIGCVLSADVFARFCRSKGLQTRFVCGTDEHGTTTEVKALEEGLTPKEVCDKYYAVHKEIYEWFGCSFDAFGRTSTEAQKRITQEIFLKLKANGYIIEDFLEELYCEKCAKSLADRFVEGICPHCGYDGARGDQCDKCGHMLNPFELKAPRCKVCGATPVKKSTKHLFLDLAKLQPQIEEWVEKASKKGEWSDNTIQYTKAWLKEGLKKRCISRQLKWGIPIPLKGFEQMVFYVWFDAPIGYISITANKFDDWKNWWMNPEGVSLYQFMGKDNVPFHTILFPGTLMGTRDKYTFVNHMSTTEFLNYEDSKFSKSRGTGVFGDDAMKTGLPADSFRYYLLINRPERSDTVFSWDDFQEKLNSELIGNLGNLVNRTLVFLDKYFDGEIPAGDVGPAEKSLLDEMRPMHENVTHLLQKVKLKDALREIMLFSAAGNKYFQDSEPWRAVKEDRKKASSSLFVLANIVKDLGILIEPFLPKTGESIFKQLAIEKKGWDDLGRHSVEKGHHIGKPEVLFNKLLDEDKVKLKERFGAKKDKDSPKDADGKNEGQAKKSGAALLNLKVAQIKEAKAHPQADKLVVLKLDLGSEERQIVAGIRAYYNIDELPGKKLIIVSNLKPAKLRGEVSEGMLLACSDEKNNLGLLSVKSSAPGCQVVIEGIEPNNGVISIDDFITVKLEGKGGKAFCEGTRLLCGAEEVFVEKGIEGKIR